MSKPNRMNLRALASATAVAALAAAAHAQDALPEVTIWVQSGPEAEALQATADAYTEATGNPVTIGVQGRAGWRQRYETALAAGSTEFDGVLHISRFVPALAAGGLIEPLTPFIEASEDWMAEDFSDIIVREMSYEGDWFMAPTDITLETLVYRTDLIPEPPATWDELRENALEFTEAKNPDSPTRYGYAYAASSGNMIGTFLGVMGSYGADYLDDEGCVTVDTAEFKEAFEFFIGLKNSDEVTPPDINAWDYPELLVGLQNGTLAQASFFTAGMPILLSCEETPDYCQNIALVAQPAGPAGSATRVNPLGIMMNASSENKEAAWAFISYATGPEGASIYTTAGGQSPRQSVLSDAAFVEERPWLPEVQKASNAGVGTIRVAQSRELAEAFDRFAQQAVAGQIAPGEAMDAAAEEMRAIMNNAESCTN